MFHLRLAYSPPILSKISPSFVVVGLETETCIGTGDVARDRHDLEWDIVRCTSGFRAQSGSQRSPLFKSADEARRWVEGGLFHVGLSDTVVFGVVIGVIGLALLYGLAAKVLG